MKKTILILAAMAAIAVPAMNAQDEGPKLKLTPTGRLLIDGAVNAGPDKEEFKDGLAIPDARLGLKASYGKWSTKIDIGFAKNKVGIKDLFVQYSFDSKNSIKGGSFIHQYGLQSATSSSMKCTFEEPVSNSVFNADRQIGVMYQYNGDKYMGTASAHVEPQSIVLNPTQLNEQGYGFLTRQVFRPIHSDGTVVQVGMSAGFLTPQTGGEGNPHNVFSFNGNFPTRVNSVKELSATITDAMNQWKFSPELLLAKGPVALEAQYFFNRVNMRQNLHNFTGQGAYCTLRGLLTGGSYGYAMGDAGLATPAPKQLELCLMYNYTKLSDSKAQFMNSDGTVGEGIYGGRVNTFSATFNYYINKYMLVRLNYAYTHRWDSATMPVTNLSTVQARFQFIF